MVYSMTALGSSGGGNSGCDSVGSRSEVAGVGTGEVRSEVGSSGGAIVWYE